MMDKLVLAGFGGQGVLFIGKVLTYAGMLDDLAVCWMPSYGPEMRGGTANCSVILSDEEIYSPVIELADAGIVLNQPSYEKFMPRIKPGGTLIANTPTPNTDNKRNDITTIFIPADSMANDMGNPGLANMICLGALIPNLTIATLSNVEKAINAIIGKKKPELYTLNMEAIHKGLEYYNNLHGARSN